MDSPSESNHELSRVLEIIVAEALRYGQGVLGQLHKEVRLALQILPDAILCQMVIFILLVHMCPAPALSRTIGLSAQARLRAASSSCRTSFGQYRRLHSGLF